VWIAQQKIYRRFFEAVRVKWRGKSSPRFWQQKRQCKPHLMQDQTEMLTWLTFSLFSGISGRSLETAGNGGSREMATA